MTYFDKMLLNYLRAGKVRMELTGFDQKDFERALNSGLKRRLETIEYIVFEDTKPDAQKVAAIRNLFQRDFYDDGAVLEIR